MSGLDYNKKIFAVITGASQGIGSTIAVELAAILEDDSKVVLIARTESNLLKTKKSMTKKNKSIKIEVCCIDLANINFSACETILNESLSDISECIYEVGVIFHNAGQLGELKCTVELNDVDLWKNYYAANLFGTVILNSVVLNRIQPYIPDIFIVNMTSILSRKPFASLSMYCSVKAARNLFFSVMALEEPGLKILSYSPGPVDTDMFATIVHKADNETRKAFQKLKSNKSVLTTKQAVLKLLSILEIGEFQSGDFVDYFGRQ